MDKDLPVPVGDCALTVTTRRKAATVSGVASLQRNIIAVEIIPRGADPIPLDGPATEGTLASERSVESAFARSQEIPVSILRHPGAIPEAGMSEAWRGRP